MQIQVDAVKAHIARTNDAHDSVQIRAVIIAQTARVVDDLRDFEDVLVENTDCIGVREHQSRRLRPDGGAERREIDAAVCTGRDIDHAEARHDGRGRIRAVGGVRDDDLCPGRIAACKVIRLDEQQAGKLAVRACGGLERERVHTGHFAKQLSRFIQQLQRALRRLLRLERMEPRKARQRRKGFIDLGVVLHRARAQRIEAVVHAVDAVRQRGIVPDKLIFAHLRQAQRLLARRCQRHDGHVARRKQRQAVAGRALFKDRLHWPLTSCKSPITWSSVFLSVSSVTHQRIPPSTGRPPRIPCASNTASARSGHGQAVTNSWKNSPG